MENYSRKDTGTSQDNVIRKYVAWAMDLGMFLLCKMVQLGYFVFDCPIPGIRF